MDTKAAWDEAYKRVLFVTSGYRHDDERLRARPQSTEAARGGRDGLDVPASCCW